MMGCGFAELSEQELTSINGGAKAAWIVGGIVTAVASGGGTGLIIAGAIMFVAGHVY